MNNLLEALKKWERNLVKKKLRLVDAYRSVFQTEAGKIVLADMAKKAGMLDIPVQRTRSEDFSFWEGKRASVLEVMKVLKYDELKLIETLDKGIDEDEY